MFRNLLKFKSIPVGVETRITCLELKPINPEGLRQDIGEFFSLPIPRAIWEKIKSLQNEDFVRFC